MIGQRTLRIATVGTNAGPSLNVCDSWADASKPAPMRTPMPAVDTVPSRARATSLIGALVRNSSVCVAVHFCTTITVPNDAAAVMNGSSTLAVGGCRIMRPDDPGLAARVLFTIALSGALVAGDRYLRAMLHRIPAPDRSLVRVPARGAREPLPRWQRRVVAFMLFAPMALQELLIAVSLLVGHGVSVSAEVRSFGWDLMRAVVMWLVFRAVLIAREMRRPSLQPESL